MAFTLLPVHVAVVNDDYLPFNFPREPIENSSWGNNFTIGIFGIIKIVGVIGTVRELSYFYSELTRTKKFSFANILRLTVRHIISC